MKRIFSICIFLLAVIFGMAQKVKTVTIKGTVTGDTKGLNAVYFFTSSTPMDSAMISNGKFTIKIPFTQTYTQALFTQYEMGPKRMGSYRPFPLLIDGSGNIDIRMNIADGFWKSSISGSKTAVAYYSFLQQQNEVYRKINDGVMILYGKSWVREDDPLAAPVSKSRDSLTKIYMGNLVSDFVNANKNSFIGVYILANAGRSAFDTDRLEVLLKSLSPELQKTDEGEKLAAYIYGVRNTSVGVTIRNFELNDQNGKAVSFAQFKGKYVWIDFWASWCGPCKQAFPRMKEIYAAYKAKGFEIVGVSADAKIDPWLKILPKLENPWTQLWDNKNITSQFAVTSFPTGYLIDPNGKIMVKEVGFNDQGKGEIELKLEELFGAAATMIKKPENKELSQDTTKRVITKPIPMLRQQ